MTKGDDEIASREVQLEVENMTMMRVMRVRTSRRRTITLPDDSRPDQHDALAAVHSQRQPAQLDLHAHDHCEVAAPDGGGHSFADRLRDDHAATPRRRR